MQSHKQHITDKHKMKQVNKSTTSTTQRCQTHPWKLNHSSSINSTTIHGGFLHKLLPCSALCLLSISEWILQCTKEGAYILFSLSKAKLSNLQRILSTSIKILKCLLIYIILQMRLLWMPLVNDGATIPRRNSKFKIELTGSSSGNPLSPRTGSLGEL